MTEPVAPESGAYASSQPNQYSAPGAPQKAPVLSIISMIAGIVGLLTAFFGFGILFAIAAVVLGHLGQKKDPAQAKGFWVTGLITGYLGVVANLAVIIISVIVLGAAFSQLPSSY